MCVVAAAGGLPALADRSWARTTGIFSVTLARRWAVERTFAWLTARHRLARDYERHPAVSEAMIRWTAINTITRHIARGGPATRQQRRTFTAGQLIFSNTFSGACHEFAATRDACAEMG